MAAPTTYPTQHILTSGEAAAQFAALPFGTAVRHRRTTTSTGTTTEVGVIRIDGIAVTAGRAYHLSTAPLALNSTVAGDYVLAQIRYDATGASATTASTLMPGSAHTSRDQTGVNNIETGVISTTYYPVSSASVSLLLTVSRSVGTGTATILADGTYIIELIVEDIGPAPTDTGVDI